MKPIFVQALFANVWAATGQLLPSTSAARQPAGSSMYAESDEAAEAVEAELVGGGEDHEDSSPSRLEAVEERVEERAL